MTLKEVFDFCTELERAVDVVTDTMRREGDLSPIDNLFEIVLDGARFMLYSDTRSELLLPDAIMYASATYCAMRDLGLIVTNDKGKPFVTIEYASGRPCALVVRGVTNIPNISHRAKLTDLSGVLRRVFRLDSAASSDISDGVLSLDVSGARLF